MSQHNQYIPPENLKSQKYLNEINEWTERQKMLINQKKTKTMIFNFTDKYQFTTRLSLKDKTVEVINQTKLLGTVVTDDLKWDKNTAHIVKNANARMALLRKVTEFSQNKDELKNIYMLYIRSQIEQSCVVYVDCTIV